ncbi:MAG: NUDIX hydrolase [archaeon]|nr:NUDIX hydrolase [archaeon]
MSPEDTDQTVYTVAFDGDRFLMVWNSKRNGWEMPGGHVKSGETLEQAAVREFEEEAGHSVELLGIRPLEGCHVCAARLGDRISEHPEMRVELFTEIPEELFFDREEYVDVISWARSVIMGK